MAIASDGQGQFSYFNIVLFVRELALNEPICNSFSFRTWLKAFQPHAGKAIMYRFGSLSPIIVVNLHQINALPQHLLYACHYFASFPFSPFAAALCARAYSTTRCIS